MHKALFYEIIKSEIGTHNSVRCHLCPHNCIIADGHRGICNVRENQRGILYSLVYGKVIAAHVDPIEKKPLEQFMQGTLTYTIATAGCNFKCGFCQNYDISQATDVHFLVPDRSPSEIVNAAIAAECPSISYSYTEPTIYYEFAYDCAVLAHGKGLKNVWVSNGFINPEPLKQIAPYLDAANIDIKSFSEDFYRKICKSRLQPVLDSIKLMKQNNIWIELTTLIIPKLNDSPEELKQIANWIKNEVGAETPWHVSALFPTYKMTDRPPTPKESVIRAQEIGLEAGLKHVYTGNI